MARDMERRKAYNDKWKEENTVRYSLRITKSSDIPKAISAYAEKQGIGETAVVRQAVIEKLQREGYLSSGNLSSEKKEGEIK